jgi:hypothetical protein
MKHTGMICKNCGKEIIEYGILTDAERETYLLLATKLNIARSAADPRNMTRDAGLDAITMRAYFTGAIDALSGAQNAFNRFMHSITVRYGVPVRQAYIMHNHHTNTYAVCQCDV